MCACGSSCMIALVGTSSGTRVKPAVFKCSGCRSHSTGRKREDTLLHELSQAVKPLSRAMRSTSSSGSTGNSLVIPIPISGTLLPQRLLPSFQGINLCGSAKSAHRNHPGIYVSLSFMITQSGMKQIAEGGVLSNWGVATRSIATPASHDFQTLKTP